MDLLAREKKIRIELEQVLARILEQFAPETTIADFNVNKITREFIKDSGIEELLNMACESEYLKAYKDAEEQGLLLRKEDAVDEGYLQDWYIHSVDDNEPIWTEEHLSELFKDFILIPKKEEAEQAPAEMKGEKHDL